MSSDKKDIIYSARDIEQYLAGDLSAKQMHKMEKAALDDPFLAEAMEGYAGMKDTGWKDQLVAVQKQVSEKTALAKVVPLHKSTRRWWKVAAAVLIIGCGTALTFILVKDSPADNPKEQIAQSVSSANKLPDTIKEKAGQQVTPTISPAVAGSEIKPDTGILRSTSKNKQAAVSADEEDKTNATGLISEKKTNIKADSAFIYRPGKTEPGDRAKAGNTGAANYDIAKTPAIPLPSSSAANNSVLSEETYKYKAKESAKFNNNSNEDLLSSQAASNRKEQQLVNSFNAQVVGTDNSPLPFSNISIKDEKFGTYADVKGNFRLVSMDTLLTVEVRSVGYLPKTFSLRSNQPMNRIILEEDQTALNASAQTLDKDFIASRTPRRASVLADSLVTAEPKDGWENYNTYVANNIPDVLLKNDFHGEVGISFDIRTNGTITNIRIDKSLGDAYDEAAKKLIQQGPQWKLKKGKKTSASVTVQF